MPHLPKGAEALLIALQTPNLRNTIGIPVLIWGKPGGATMNDQPAHQQVMNFMEDFFF